MIVYFIFYALIGVISASLYMTVVGLTAVVITTAIFGIVFLPLNLIAFGFGYVIGEAIRAY